MFSLCSVLVLKKLGGELEQEFLDVVHYLGQEEDLHVVVEEDCYTRLTKLHQCTWLSSFSPGQTTALHSAVDFVVSLGGDGLILHAAHLFGTAVPPLISFKLGSLGFLTCHDYRDFRHHLHDVIHGSQVLAGRAPPQGPPGKMLHGVNVTLRMRLSCVVERAARIGGQDPPACETQGVEVLNEVVLSRGANPFLCNIEVQADGILVATPTGSTAYSVSAGGSMVHPGCPAILLTPISPHSLSFRPIILPDHAQLRLRVSPEARCAAQVSFDGRCAVELGPGDALRVRMGASPLPTINRAGQTADWFGSIDRCFHWNDRLGQKMLAQAVEDTAQPPGPAGTASSVGRQERTA